MMSNGMDTFEGIFGTMEADSLNQSFGSDFGKTLVDQSQVGNTLEVQSSADLNKHLVRTGFHLEVV